MLRYGTCAQGISQFYLHTHTFIRNQNEPYLPLPSQPQLVLTYRPQRGGRLSRPWCEVAQAEIRTCNLPIANLELYHTATRAPTQPLARDVNKAGSFKVKAKAKARSLKAKTKAKARDQG